MSSSLGMSFLSRLTGRVLGSEPVEDMSLTNLEGDFGNIMVSTPALNTEVEFDKALREMITQTSNNVETKIVANDGGDLQVNETESDELPNSIGVQGGRGNLNAPARTVSTVGAASQQPNAAFEYQQGEVESGSYDPNLRIELGKSTRIVYMSESTQTPQSTDRLPASGNSLGYVSNLSADSRMPHPNGNSRDFPANSRDFQASVPSQRGNFTPGVNPSANSRNTAMPVHGSRQVPVPSRRAISNGSNSQNVNNQSFRTMRKMIVPDKYDGRGEWDEYLAHFITVATWNGWTDDEQTMQLGLNMTGRARSVYSGLAIDVKSDFTRLLFALNRVFGSEGKEAAFKAEFRQRRRLVGESLRDLADDLSKLCNKAFPNMDRAARGEVVVEQFKLCVDLELRKHIQFAHVSSLEDAVIAAMEYEAMDEGRRVKKPVVINQVQVNSGTPSSELSTLAAALERVTLLTETNAKLLEEINRKRQPKRCFRCNEVGHMKRDCPLNH